MLGRILAAFGAAAVRQQVSASIDRIKLRAMLLAAALVCWLLVVGYLFATLTVWLVGLVGPIFACLILAVAFAVIAVAIHVYLGMTKHHGTPLTRVLSGALAPLKEAPEAKADGEPPGAGSPPPEVMSLGAILMVAALGYVMGRSITDLKP